MKNSLKVERAKKGMTQADLAEKKVFPVIPSIQLKTINFFHQHSYLLK